MLASAKMILHSHRLATQHSCLASTGILKVLPGSTNTVPGTAIFSLDIRASEDSRLMDFEEQLKMDFNRIGMNESVGDLNRGGTIGKVCSVDWNLDAPSEAITFNEDCIRCVEDSASVGIQFFFVFVHNRLVEVAPLDSPHGSAESVASQWVANSDIA